MIPGEPAACPHDAKSNTVLWGAGNPTPDFDPSVRKGDNLYSNSTLALDADTGKIKFYFQYTPNDSWDYDGNNETILVDDEKGRKVWLHGDRNGHLYSIDRTNGKCNWVVPIARVNWVTGFRDNCVPIVNPEKVPGYDKVATDIAPILDGGKEWHPAAYSPLTKLIYVPFIDGSMDIQAKKQEWKRGEWFLSSKVLKANPYTGGVKAFNATSGELVWTRPQSTPATSGLIATAGGLVFTGDAEGYFSAIKDDTGEDHLYRERQAVRGNRLRSGGRQSLAARLRRAVQAPESWWGHDRLRPAGLNDTIARNASSARRSVGLVR